MGKDFAVGPLRVWLGAACWGWRLWGMSLGAEWFIGLSRALPGPAEIERHECWRAVCDMIEPGELPGNGWDRHAQRNGIVLAANAIQDRLLNR